MTTTSIPGSGMTYTDLCNTDSGSEARKMWHALASLADVIGVSTLTAQQVARTKTVDEFIEDITSTLPAEADVIATALAVAEIESGLPAYEHRYEVRRLTPYGLSPGKMRAVVEATASDYGSAAKIKAQYEAEYPRALFVLVGIKVTTKPTLYPSGYVPSP